MSKRKLCRHSITGIENLARHDLIKKHRLRELMRVARTCRARLARSLAVYDENAAT